MISAIDPDAVGLPEGGAHTLFGEGGVPALVVYDSPLGVLLIGPYDRVLHANLATYVSSGADKFPWWRHSSSWYLKRRIIQHNQSQGR